MKCFSYKGVCGILILRHVKEELIWAIHTINILMLLVIVIMLFEKLNTTEKVKNIYIKTVLYSFLCGP